MPVVIDEVEATVQPERNTSEPAKAEAKPAGVPPAQLQEKLNRMLLRRAERQQRIRAY